MERIPEPEQMDTAESAEAYAAARFEDVNEAYVARLLELAGTADAPLRLLDLGAGPGDIPTAIAKRRPRWPVYAVEAATAMCRIARDRLPRLATPSNHRYIQADAKTMPFRSGQFEVVSGNSILHHIHDTQRFWQEVHRVLAPAGLLFMRDLVRPPSREAARALVREHAGAESVLLQQEFFHSLLAAFMPTEVAAQLDAAGLGYLHVAQVTDRHLDIWGRRPRR